MQSVQVSFVTTPTIVKAGPCWFYGFSMHLSVASSGITMTCTDSSSSGVTGKKVLSWAQMPTQPTLKHNRITEFYPVPMKCVDGLRAEAVGFPASSGATCLVFWG